jgi:hypothetical protein
MASQIETRSWTVFDTDVSTVLPVRMADPSQQANLIWSEKASNQNGYGHEEDSDSDDPNEVHYNDEDADLRALQRAIPKRRQVRSMVYEDYFNSEDFMESNLKLWKMSRTLNAWDNPPYAEFCTMDDRIQYARNVCSFCYWTLDHPNVEKRVKSKSQKTHWVFPWLHKISNTPRAEALYRIALLACETLRRSHFICCQPYNTLTATQFDEERRRVLEVLGLLNYLQTVILPLWIDLEWDKHAAMDCSKPWLASMTQWILALAYFMTGTVMMNRARGLESTPICERKTQSTVSGPGMRTDTLRAKDIVSGLFEVSTDSKSKDAGVLSGVSNLMRYTNNALVSQDELMSESRQASAEAQAVVQQGQIDTMRIAACMFYLGTETLSKQATHRPVYWLQEEMDALKEDECFESLEHNINMVLPSHLDLTRASEWRMRAQDERCQEWARMPWPARMMGLWLRCEGDVYMAQSTQDNTALERPFLQVMGALCHVVALQEFGVNIVTEEEIARSMLSVDDIHKGIRPSTALKNFGRHGSIRGVANTRSDSARSVQFDFLTDTQASYLKGVISTDTYGNEENLIRIPWDQLHKVVAAEDVSEVKQMMAQKVASLLPNPTNRKAASS